MAASHDRSDTTPLDLDGYAELLRPADLVRILGVSTDTAYRLCHSKDFPVVKVGASALYIPKGRFLKWLGYGRIPSDVPGSADGNHAEVMKTCTARRERKGHERTETLNP